MNDKSSDTQTRSSSVPYCNQ